MQPPPERRVVRRIDRGDHHAVCGGAGIQRVWQGGRESIHEGQAYHGLCLGGQRIHRGLQLFAPGGAYTAPAKQNHGVVGADAMGLQQRVLSHTLRSRTTRAACR